jgi:cellulose synthase/poly-beta-1,6-N-acetylglucosamine synthase-like glycosyltransferase
VIRHVIVVVPAHDEVDTIGACLRSLHDACRRLPDVVSTAIVVVADSCRDHSPDVARALSRSADDVVIEADDRCAGSARRIGVSAALLRAPVGPAEVWIASTDADTVVPVDWLSRQVTLADAGFVGVAGTVRIDAGHELSARFTRSYPIAVDGSHHHVHGANLGFRGDVYLASGGWNALATAEDHDLWNRVRECGRTLTTSTTCVTTSHRIVGRAPHGFAADMAHLDMAHLDTAQRHMTRREEAVA